MSDEGIVYLRVYYSAEWKLPLEVPKGYAYEIMEKFSKKSCKYLLVGNKKYSKKQFLLIKDKVTALEITDLEEEK